MPQRVVEDRGGETHSPVNSGAAQFRTGCCAPGFVTGEVSAEIDGLAFGNCAERLVFAKERLQVALDVFVDDQRRSLQIGTTGKMVGEECPQQHTVVGPTAASLLARTLGISPTHIATSGAS